MYKNQYKAYKVKSRILFYRKSEDEVTEIVRVLHQRIDIEDRLK